MSEGVYTTYELRVRTVEALSRGLPLGEVAGAYGVDRTTLYRWHKRYESQGERGLIRRLGSGRPRTLEELDEEELRAIVLKPASAFGYETDLWTVRRLHGVIRDRFEVDISRDTIWRRLREAGLGARRADRGAVVAGWVVVAACGVALRSWAGSGLSELGAAAIRSRGSWGG